MLGVFPIEGRLILTLTQTRGNINILQNDIQELKSEILKKMTLLIA